MYPPFTSVAGGRKRGMKRGIPNKLMSYDNKAKKIDPTFLPTVEEAVGLYPGTISESCSFGMDPLESNSLKQKMRYESFCSRYSFESLFTAATNGCGSLFAGALIFFIDITYRLSHTS